MSIFENLEAIFQEWRLADKHVASLVTLATALGVSVAVLYSLCMLWRVSQGINRFVLARWCCKTDYVRKYGKWAVISGSTDGIGLAMAKELAGRGHSLVLLGRNPDKLARTKEAICSIQNCGQVLTAVCDFSDPSPENYEQLWLQIGADTKDIGILINNAGVMPASFRRFGSTDPHTLTSVVNVNILSTVQLTRHILPGMVKRCRGMIVNVSSMSASCRFPYTGGYAPSKSYITAFTAGLQYEYKDHPIDIIDVQPGPIYTKLLTNAMKRSSANVILPDSTTFARSLINCCSTRPTSTTGYLWHGIMMYILLATDPMYKILLPLSYKYNGKDLSLSPVMKRRNTEGSNNA